METIDKVKAVVLFVMLFPLALGLGIGAGILMFAVAVSSAYELMGNDGVGLFLNVLSAAAGG